MDWYLWIKALHVIADIAWMAGMLYLPRLFIYHVDAIAGSVQSETFKTMERRLLRFIMTPAMVVSWITGFALVYILFGDGGIKGAGWLHGKLLLVLLMSGAHGFFAGAVKRFAQDANRRSARFYRFMNEAPTVLMIGIVVLVIVKPFAH